MKRLGVLTLNNINHTNCLDYVWDDEVEKMLDIISFVANM